MGRALLTSIVVFLLLAGERSAAEEKKQISVNVENRAVAADINIHYTGRYCLECHVKQPTVGGDPLLQYNGDFKSLCRCHGNMQDTYHHPTDILPPQINSIKIPTEFPLWKGKIDCITCHDVARQCRVNEFKEVFLRGAPYPRPTAFCYQCHDQQAYARFDPHQQIDASGVIVESKCLYCHEEKPDVQHAKFKDLKLLADLEILCRRCHFITGNHSGNFNHMTKPSPKGLARLKRMRKKFKIILPLTIEGKMTCVTCHNPHQKGVIPEERPSAKGADSHYRHRLPERICIECHEM